MKKLFIALALCASFPAFAFDFPPTTQVKQEDYQCAQHGGGFAIKVSEPARVWQVDSFAGQKVEGLELQNVQIQRARCIGCFRFTAEMLSVGQALQYDGTVETSFDGKVALTLKVSQERGSEVAKFKMPCVHVSR